MHDIQTISAFSACMSESLDSLATFERGRKDYGTGHDPAAFPSAGHRRDRLDPYLKLFEGAAHTDHAFASQPVAGPCSSEVAH